MGGNNSKPKKGPTSSAKMSDQKKFIDDALKAHNSYRARHQVAPLSHNKDLSAHAQKWAEHLAARDQFQHSDCNYKGERVGENIAMKWSSEPAAYTGQEATDQWYSEIKLHQTFGARTSPSGTGHFTQVVWKGSKELGVGRAMTKDNKVIVVANYRPAGNFVGDYAANVLPPKDGKIVLPPEPENKPMRMTYSSDKDGGSGSGGMKSFEDMKKEMFGRHGGDSRGFSSGGGGGESRSTRTYTHTEGSGSNKVTKIVTEETIIKSNGEKIINKTEKVIRG